MMTSRLYVHFRLNRLDRFSVGQNVAATWTYEKPSPTGEEPEFKRQIEAWFNEVTQIGFRPKDIDPFSFNRQAGHYSQVRFILYIVAAAKAGQHARYDRLQSRSVTYVTRVVPVAPDRSNSHLLSFKTDVKVLVRSVDLGDDVGSHFHIGREDAGIVRNEIIRVEWASLPIAFDAPSNSQTRPRDNHAECSPHPIRLCQMMVILYIFFNYANSQSRENQKVRNKRN